MRGRGPETYVAVDLGAGSGRVIAGTFDDDGRLVQTELHRFPNRPRVVDGRERWDVDALLDGIVAGLERLGPRARDAVSIGVDTWGVDYGLCGADGALLEAPVCYRDARHDGAVERVRAALGDFDLYAATGIQAQPFNTLQQVVAQRALGEWPDGVERLLLMPDLFHVLLGGDAVAERTIASTTGMLDATTGGWHDDLLARLDVPRDVLPRLVDSGTRVGTLRAELQRRSGGVGALAIVAPGAHDTASAVAGTPLEPGWAFLSSGTWSLLGVELDEPNRSAAAAADNFTNERGVGEHGVRFLANIMGLWLLDECVRGWEAEDGAPIDRDALLAAAEASPPSEARVHPDDVRFFHPADMAAELRAALAETGHAPTASNDRPALVRVIVDSLAARYAAVVARIEAVTGRAIAGVHVIGGGSRNAFLNRATARALGRPVRVGPVEATATGNLVAQAVAAGRFRDFADARAALRATTPVATIEPT